jgi:glutathione S-transferase
MSNRSIHWLLMVFPTYAMSLNYHVGPVDTLTSGLASLARLPYGTDVAGPISTSTSTSASARAVKDASLILYEFEGCPFCRRVRELITYLDLTCTIKPCAQSSCFRHEVEQLSGRASPTFPYLIDATAGVALFESADICKHLLRTYGECQGVHEFPPPSSYFLPSTFISGWAPALFRPGRGMAVDEAVRGRPTASQPSQLLVLYSYEGNQFCRLVREVLCELDLMYELRSTGKGSARREELRSLSGATTAPYLVDPNTGESMGESADIVQYLVEQYGS